MTDLVSARDIPSERSIRWRVTHDARVRYVLLVGVLAAAYYAAAKVGYVLEFAGPVAAIVWLPVGIGIAFLSLGGVHYWPGVLIGDLLANDYSTLPLGSALGQTVGNVLEVCVAALLIRRIARRGSPLGSVGGLGRMFAAIVVGTAVSATIGSLSNWLGGVIASDAVPTVWRTWWLADTCGALVVVPLALAWHGSLRRGWSRERALEGALLIAAVIGVSELALRSHRPLTYAVFPVLIWAALRFGQRGATLAVAITASLTVWNTTHFQGPFAFDSITRSILSTQLFIAVAALSTMFLAAVVSEREEISKGLLESRARLVGIADRERRRLERNLHDGAQLTLTMLAGQLATAREDSLSAPDQAPVLFQDAEKQVLVAIDELRELAHGIHPTVLTDLGLAEAIRSLTTGSPVPIQLLELPSARLDPTAEATAYYVVAEALTNAQRHAHAEAITIRVAELSRALRIEVGDNGDGGANERVGSGLQGLRDRVEAVGGVLRVESIPGRGTLVRAGIPLAGARRSSFWTSDGR
jgi:signal transduction histidine kinase